MAVQNYEFFEKRPLRDRQMDKKGVRPTESKEPYRIRGPKTILSRYPEALASRWS